MPRRYVSQLTHQDSVDEVFVVSEKQLRPNRNGNLYLQFQLSDRSGTIGARMWNADESMYRAFENGDFVRVEGNTQLFNGAVQLIATHIERAEPGEFDPDDFTPVSSVQIDRLMQRLEELLRSVEDPALRNLADCFLDDREMMQRLTQAPAGVRMHHAYRGGLLEHIVNLMEIVVRIAPCYPQIDRDLLLFGAFLHDLGKVQELAYDREFVYTDEGQLIGHLVLAVGMLDAKAAAAELLSGEPVPAETLLRLKHMLVSHHGEYEYGSPKLPMTLEAVALYCLDNLDAKVAAFYQMIRDDPNVDSPWTNFNHLLNRKIFKGQPKGRPGGA